MAPKSSKSFLPSSDPRFDFRGLKPAHLYLPITDINLVVHFEHEGVCDERTDLSFRPKRGDHSDPPRANHFSIWFGFGGHETVAMHITQPNYPFNPYTTDVYLSNNTAVVRVFSEKIPSELDIGSVYRERTPRQGITVAHIIEIIDESKRQCFLFRTVEKQKVGCRHWIHTITRDLERAGIMPRGYADKVLRHLGTYYGRYQHQDSTGRWVGGSKWAARPEFKCPEIQMGILPTILTSLDQVKRH
ncbi:hypothetical protein DXG01_002672 [Tephrocybe rancida]|nr:hypothetical protein DXG01_002672 [Tephrocybe rancida]